MAFWRHRSATESGDGDMFWLPTDAEEASALLAPSLRLTPPVFEFLPPPLDQTCRQISVAVCDIFPHTFPTLLQKSVRLYSRAILDFVVHDSVSLSFLTACKLLCHIHNLFRYVHKYNAVLSASYRDFLSAAIQQPVSDSLRQLAEELQECCQRLQACTDSLDSFLKEQFHADLPFLNDDHTSF